MSAKPKLMVVDDLDSARHMMKRSLARSYDVYDFGAVADALPALDRAEFDAIVTDLRMPGIDGIEGLRRFKAKVPEIPVILVTAFATVDTAVEAMKAGAFDYLTKPFEPEELGDRRRPGRRARPRPPGERPAEERPLRRVHGPGHRGPLARDEGRDLDPGAHRAVGRPHPHRGGVRHRQGPPRPRGARHVPPRRQALTSPST